jgi:DNA-binding NarL/FixJ family response regulator
MALSPGLERTTETVVIAAAEPLVRRGLAAVLGDHFAVVQTAGTVRAAQRVLAHRPLPPLVLVLDPPFPDASAEEACAVVLQPDAALGTLVLLRHPDPQLVRLVSQYGARGVFDMNIAPDLLRAALGEIRRGEAVFDPALARHLVEGDDRDQDEPANGCSLSERQVQALRLLADGLSSKEIARTLCTTADAVDHVIERASRRLGASHRAQAVAVAIRSGLFD